MEETTAEISINTLIDMLRESIGIDAAKNVTYEALKVTDLPIKSFYSPQEFRQICAVLEKKGGVINIIATHVSKSTESMVHYQRDLAKERTEKENLIQLNKTLDEMIQKKTRELNERTKELERVNKELAEINKELDDFTYTVSHDLKEPLRSIDAFSRFVQDDCADKLSAEDKNYLERIRANASRLADLIEDLLKISRIGRKVNPFEEVELMHILRMVEDRVAYRLAEKKAQLIIKEPLPHIYCDRVRITEVFANLVSNALKFTDKPTPIVEVGCSDENDSYRFYVKDNGIGIKGEYLGQIFKIFHRLHTREEYEGTGAGLAICKKIVEYHRGKIWVESHPGEGSTFYFTLPKKQDPPAEKAEAAQ